MRNGELEPPRFAPGLLLRALSASLAIAGSDALAEEAKRTVEGILQQASDEKLRSRFLSSELIVSAAP